MRVWRVMGGLGCLAFLPPVVAAWSETPAIPAELRWLSVAVLAVSVAMPSLGLLTTAFLVPASAYLHAVTQSGVTSAASAEILLAPFLLGAGMRMAFGAAAPPARLTKPALFFGALIACGGVVGLVAQQQVTSWPGEFWRDFVRHLPTTYFDEAPVFAPYHMAITWIEGLTLAVFAERLLRTARWGWPSVLIAGATAAAATAWIRLIQVGLRTDQPLATMWRVLEETRISTLFRDVNAAGSMFALFLLPAAWLTYRALRPIEGERRWLPAIGYGLATIVIALALRMTVSRAAYAGAVLALSALWIASRRTSKLMMGIGATIAGAALLVFVFFNPGSDAQASSTTSVGIRVEMARIALKITGRQPVFGVGLGEFRRESRSYIPPALMELFPNTRVGENAHNNFLQILAELGIAGFAGFMWLLVAAGRGVPRAATARAVVPRALAGGAFAFLVSCLGGHPFLTIEVFWAFCLVVGATAGLGDAAPESGTTVWSRRVAFAAMGLVLASVPIRIWQLRFIDMRRNYVGAGPLKKDEDGVKFYEAKARSRWWIPRESRRVEIPLRLKDSAAPCLVQIAVDGKPANAVQAEADRWARTTIELDTSRRGPPSRSIDLSVDRADCLPLLVGDMTTWE